MKTKKGIKLSKKVNKELTLLLKQVDTSVEDEETMRTYIKEIEDITEDYMRNLEDILHQVESAADETNQEIKKFLIEDMKSKI